MSASSVTSQDQRAASLTSVSSALSSSLIDSLVSGDRKDVGGILCNDPSGLCLASRGALDASNSGVYTNLTKLASQLSGNSNKNANISGSSTSSSNNNNSSNASTTDSAPLITIECEKTCILVKEYDGHAVALRVPSATSTKTTTEAS